MTRRASLPGASELFRRTSGSGAAHRSITGPAHDPAADQAMRKPGSSAESAKPGRAGAATQSSAGRGSPTQSSGRQKHDTKITVYLSADELLAMEQARLTLRGAHELPVDRGRIVREAVAVLLEDFDQNGADSVLVQRLRGQQVGG